MLPAVRQLNLQIPDTPLQFGDEFFQCRPKASLLRIRATRNSIAWLVPLPVDVRHQNVTESIWQNCGQTGGGTHTLDGNSSMGLKQESYGCGEAQTTPCHLSQSSVTPGFDWSKRW
jgi:hypothetical protein